jgi:hypothetical protein
MIVADISPGPDGFEHRKFECRKCGHIESEVVACDPLRSDAIGWLSGELVGPTPWFTKAMKDRQITNIRSNSHAATALLADKAATTDDNNSAVTDR